MRVRETVACQRCSRNPSTVHLTLVSKEVAVDVHLCETCSVEIREKGEYYAIPHGVKCRKCGLGLREIRDTGRLGCADDYEIFSEDIITTLEGWHGASRHVGKVPKKYSS